MLSLNDKTILLTGATGFIGRHIFNVLKNEGARIKIISRKMDTVFSEVVDKNDIIIGDLKNALKNKDFFADVDTIIHAAAKVHQMEESKRDSEKEYFNINSQLTYELAKTAIDCNVKTFIFLSTVKVVGDLKNLEQPITEKCNLVPTDPYGKSKKEAEKLLKKVYADLNDFKCVSLRLPMVYGPNNKGNMLPLLRIASKKIPLPLGLVRAKRSMIYVGNICSAIKSIITDKENVGYNDFFISDGVDYSSKELYDLIYRTFNDKKGTFNFPLFLFKALSLFSRKANKILSRLLGEYRFSINKFSNYYNWKPEFNIKFGIGETVKWYKKKYIKK